MKKNLKGLFEVIESEKPQLLVDMNQYDLIERAGMKPDLVHKKNAHMTAAWRFADASRVCIPMGGVDLGAYRYLTFSVFSVAGEGGSFSLFFNTDVKGASENGYVITLPITKNGWNDYRVELPFLHAVGEVVSWEEIKSLVFDAVIGGQSNAAETVLYIDNLYGWESYAPPRYASMVELKGAAVLSKSGNFSIVDRRRVANSIDGTPAIPFERDGVLWVPLAPIAAGFAHGAVVDNLAYTLTFTYRRRKYAFSADANEMTVDGVQESLGFYPLVEGGTLFFPIDFVARFFHRRQCYVDPMGLIVISNRKNIFDPVKDEPTVRELVADTTFLRPTADRVLADLHRRFPNASRGRLLASFDDLMQLRRDAKQDATLKRYVNALKTRFGTKTEAFLADPDTSDLARSAEYAIAFAMLYRMTGDKAYCERAAVECEMLAELSDWQVASMATVGEVALGVSIAYDWCHHVWSEGRKATIERALLRRAMRPGLDAYNGHGRMWRAGSVKGAVANVGMLAAAITLADVYPQTAYKLLDAVLRNLEPCFMAYAPDGASAESVWAWAKGTRALTLAVAMLETACGEDYGLSRAPGFVASAYFPIYTETKNGAWNYHNAAAETVDTVSLSYFAKKTGRKTLAAVRRLELASGKKDVHPFDLLFYISLEDSPKRSLPLDAAYRRAGLVALRSDWSDNANFVGLHGGRNNEHAGDLDAGSFILEMGGERFFVETGREESLPALLRRRAEGQNTVVVDPAAEPLPDQTAGAVARFTEVHSEKKRAYAVLDMSATNDLILRAKRGVLLTADRTLAVVQDEMTFVRPATVVWTAWTRAEVKLNKSGRVATLIQNGRTMECRLSGIGYPARFECRAVEGSDLSRLCVTVEGRDKLKMAVSCQLIEEGLEKKDYEFTPMSRWCKE